MRNLGRKSKVITPYWRLLLRVIKGY